MSTAVERIDQAIALIDKGYSINRAAKETGCPIAKLNTVLRAMGYIRNIEGLRTPKVGPKAAAYEKAVAMMKDPMMPMSDVMQATGLGESVLYRLCNRLQGNERYASKADRKTALVQQLRAEQPGITKSKAARTLGWHRNTVKRHWEAK